jgi:glycosyltransferase involved in cell wall biosynthesis
MGGGEEKRVRNIAQFLVRNGHQVCVFCNYPNSCELNGVQVVELRSVSTFKLLWNAIALRRELRARDIALFFCFKRAGSIIGFVLEKLGSRAQIFGNIANAWPDKAFINYLTPRRMISIHEGLNRQFSEGVSIHTIPIGVALPPPELTAERMLRKNRKNGTCQLLYVGGLTTQKRPERLLQLAAELRQRAFPFHLHILGQGPMEGKLQASAEAMGLTSVVTFVGHTSPREHYLSCDFLLLTSDYEGLPNVLLESGALGICVLSTAVGAIGTVLANGRGRALPGFAACIFADEITKLYDSLEYVTLGHELKSYVETYHNESDMLQGYLSLAERK